LHIYLHIGYPKTGSSAIQSHVFTNKKWFAERGIYIPRTGYAGALGHAFLLGGKNYSLAAGKVTHMPAGASQFEVLNKELEVASNEGFNSALLTWEGFAMLEDSGRQELGEGLGSHSVTVLAYVREQSALYQSATLQGIESLQSFSAEKLFGTGYRELAPLEKYDFHTMMSGWRMAFGKSCNVRTRLFDRSLLANGNVVTDFINWLQLQPDEELCMQQWEVNHSLDVKAAILLLIARSAGAKPHQLLGLSRSLAQLPRAAGEEDKFFLSEEDLAFFTARYAQSNEAFFEAFRPENAPESLTSFEDPLKTQKGAVSPQTSYLRAVYEALARPELEIWEGSPLIGHKVGLVAKSPNSGWRSPGPKGEWSVGSVSTLDFRIPTMHPTAGPKAILLRIAGRYFGSNTRTTVIVNGHRKQIDLSHSELSISLDSIAEVQGVQIELEHDFPALDKSPEEKDTEKGIAFMLQYLAYTLVWD
jgi:hypothetical protein